MAGSEGSSGATTTSSKRALKAASCAPLCPKEASVTVSVRRVMWAPGLRLRADATDTYACSR